MQKLLHFSLKISLFFFLIFGILGFYFITAGQEDFALLCGKIGGFFSSVFTAIVIAEVVVAKRLRLSTKLIWITAFLVFQILAGLAYYLVDRKAILQVEMH